MCRICHNTSIQDPSPLISPCACRGSMRYVHLACIQKWRYTSGRMRDFYTCSMCQANYEFPKKWGVMHESPAARAAVVLVLYFSLTFCLSELLILFLPPPTLGRPRRNIFQALFIFPFQVVRHTLDVLVWGRPVSNDSWTRLFLVPGYRSVVIARRFLVGLGLIGLIESMVTWPRLLTFLCIIFTMVELRWKSQPSELGDLSVSFVRVILTGFVLEGVGRSVLDATFGARAIARQLKYLGTREVVDRGQGYPAVPGSALNIARSIRTQLLRPP